MKEAYTLDEIKEKIEHEKYLRKENQELYEEKQVLRKIINKAKEYIKEQPFEIGCYDSKNKVFYKLDLLQILEGIEDENINEFIQRDD